MRFVIEPAYQEIASVRDLFLEYADWLDLDLSFQDYEAELRDLPGKYAPPDGRLYLARSGTTAAGCVALRRFDARRCEMKRLYVRKAFRGSGLGRLLALRLIREAGRMGYAAMVLDTLRDRMPAALALYTTLGFRETGAYYHNPVADVVYLEKPLQD